MGKVVGYEFLSYPLFKYSISLSAIVQYLASLKSHYFFSLCINLLTPNRKHIDTTLKKQFSIDQLLEIRILQTMQFLSSLAHTAMNMQTNLGKIGWNLLFSSIYEPNELFFPCRFIPGVQDTVFRM